MHDHRFDEMARLLASPMPRRQVFRHIIGGLAAATLATIGSPLRAQSVVCVTNADCGTGNICCNASICCPSVDICCGIGTTSICCPPTMVCCGGVHTLPMCCPAGYGCTNNACVPNTSPH